MQPSVLIHPLGLCLRHRRFGECVLVTLVILLLTLLPGFHAMAQVVVMEARGTAYKAGDKISPGTTISLKEGERLSLIGADGKSMMLRGPYSGVPSAGGGATLDTKQALASLLANRDARVKSVGVVRSGTASVKTPDPEAIDITRAGPRCLTEGRLPVFWRPDAHGEQPFVIFPADRSWRADFVWRHGQDRMTFPDLSKFEGLTTLLVNIDQQEHAISFSVVPARLDNDMVRASWMLEKGCVQQADALLRALASSSEGAAR